jgi:hypothetical protein
MCMGDRCIASVCATLVGILLRKSYFPSRMPMAGIWYLYYMSGPYRWYQSKYLDPRLNSLIGDLWNFRLEVHSSD